jgi:ATP-dependent DNA helicase RecQ
VLRDLARVRPTTPERMRTVSGVGDVKLRDFGGRFLPVIAQHCKEFGLATDLSPPPVAAPIPEPRGPSPRRLMYFEHFRRGATIDEVMARTGYARSTVTGYLVDFVREARPASVAPWVSEGRIAEVAGAARQVGTDRLTPIFEALGGAVTYDEIRIVLAHLAAM